MQMSFLNEVLDRLAETLKEWCCYGYVLGWREDGHVLMRAAEY